MSYWNTYTGSEVFEMISDLERAITNLIATRQADLYVCDYTETTHDYLTCYEPDKAAMVDNPERVLTMFVWAYSVGNRLECQANIDSMRENYPEFMKSYTTGETLTSDSSGIMLYLDRLIIDMASRKLSDDMLSEISFIIDTFELLYDYRVIDDERVLNYEHDTFLEQWEDEGRYDFSKEINKVLNHIAKKCQIDYEYDIDFIEIESDELLNLFYEMSGKFCDERYIIENSVYIIIPECEDMVKDLSFTLAALREFFSKLEDNEDCDELSLIIDLLAHKALF